MRCIQIVRYRFTNAALNTVGKCLASGICNARQLGERASDTMPEPLSLSLVMSHELALQSLRHALEDVQHHRISIADFCTAWRSQPALLAALPPRYAQVMEDLLGRMEAGSLFTEESCSFSQDDLQANLSIWLDKATQTLTAKA